MLEAVGEHAKGEGLDARNRLIPRLAIGQHARQVGHLRDPPAIRLELDLKRQCHAGLRKRMLEYTAGAHAGLTPRAKLQSTPHSASAASSPKGCFVSFSDR